MIEVEKLTEIVGADHVGREQAMLDDYAKDMSFVHAIKPDCVVRPATADEIGKIVKSANDTLTPLVPVSSGPPHFRGDTVPGVGGAVMVDLSRMNRVIRIDRSYRVAMCEPCVTFDDLIPALEKEGLRLNMPLLPRATKSVVGSLLDREPVTMPGYQWDIADPLDCLEIIFGTGDLFRTGGAAGPGTLEDQRASGGSQDEPLGPGQADWHRAIQGAQGTLGIVTWATMRCELLPRLEEPFLVGSSNLNKIMDMVHWLVRLRLVNECFVLNNSNMSAILAKTYPGEYESLKVSLKPWILFFNIAGYDYFPEERIGYQTKDMMEVAQRLGLIPEKKLDGISAYDVLKTVRHTSDEPYWKLRSKGACHDIFFLTPVEKLPEMVRVMFEAANESGYPASEIGVYLQPSVQGTSCHCEFNLFYDLDNRAESDRIEGLSTTAVQNLLAEGAFFSRPHGKNASMIMNRDAASLTALRKIKKIVDPNGVMNPGKLCF